MHASRARHPVERPGPNALKPAESSNASVAQGRWGTIRCFYDFVSARAAPPAWLYNHYTIGPHGAGKSEHHQIEQFHRCLRVLGATQWVNSVEIV